MNQATTPNALAAYLLALEDVHLAATGPDRDQGFLGRNKLRVEVGAGWSLERFAEAAKLLGWEEVTLGDLADASDWLGRVAGQRGVVAAGRRRDALRGVIRG